MTEQPLTLGILEVLLLGQGSDILARVPNQIDPGIKSLNGHTVTLPGLDVNAPVLPTVPTPGTLGADPGKILPPINVGVVYVHVHVHVPAFLLVFDACYSPGDVNNCSRA
jgi:hypothetical protein